MESNKITLTLFDILSYFLPGYIVLFALSIVEATFFSSDLLALSNITDNWLISSIAAYFLGQFNHRIASFLNDKRPKWFDNRDLRLMDSIYYHIRTLLTDFYSIEFKEGERLHSLETYLLADNYIIASGKTAERDSLIAREGFHKTSMIAFVILAMTVLATSFERGLSLQLSSGDYFSLNVVGTIILSSILLLITLVFWRGYAFFNRIKINNIVNPMGRD